MPGSRLGGSERVRIEALWTAGWKIPAIAAALGVLMAVLWVIFTSIHGATSVNEGREALGYDMHFWGLLLGVVPNLLIATALLILKPHITTGGSRLAVVGHAAVVVCPVASAAMDLVFRALGPPFTGLELSCYSGWRCTRPGGDDPGACDPAHSPLASW